MSFSIRTIAATAIILSALGGVGHAQPDPRNAAKDPASSATEDRALVDAINGSWRPAAEVARDKYRHPLGSLTFWGLKPGMTVVDLEPGGGYWTQILAPYALITHGKYIAGVTDLANPDLSEGGRKGRERFETKFADKTLYGAIVFANFGPKSAPFVSPGTADLVITSRELHNWAPAGNLDKIMGDAFMALKRGGYLAVEDHRADPRPEIAKWDNGYIATRTVMAAAEKAGFKLDGSSEVNANKADLKDYPYGVWTLPPTRQSGPTGKPADPTLDRAKYDAIGESDRMTLRFRKP